jgi:hypothetical protein
MKVATIFSRVNFVSLALLIFTTGCFEETRTFSVAVRNDLPSPVSVCITKSYGSLESGWESPEDLAEPPHPPSDQKPPGKVLEPGRTLVREQFTGRFPSERGHAVLRIYAGTPNLTQMTAIDIGSSSRLDVTLNPGPNRIEIVPTADGRMIAVPVSGPWPSTQPSTVHP